MDQIKEVGPIAFSPRGAAKAVNVGVNKIYDWLNSGALEAKKDGQRTIITGEALKRRIAALPSYAPSSAGAPDNSATLTPPRRDAGATFKGDKRWLTTTFATVKIGARK